MPQTLLQSPPYDRDALFHLDGPLDPIVVEEAVCTIIQNTSIDLYDSPTATARRMHAAMRGLAALDPRDEIELMTGVQIVSAHHAANACWRLGTKLRQPNSQARRYIATAAAAARTFMSLVRDLKRLQAKPLSVPVGRPAPKTWEPRDPEAIMQDWQQRAGLDDDPDARCAAEGDTMTDDEVIDSHAAKARQWRLDPDEGLDIANTEGILPGGGMIMPEEPTPEQTAYMDRRLILMYLREREENRRKGLSIPIVFRGISPGDLIP